MNGRTDGWADGRQTDRSTDAFRQTDRQKERRTDSRLMKSGYFTHPIAPLGERDLVAVTSPGLSLMDLNVREETPGGDLCGHRILKISYCTVTFTPVSCVEKSTFPPATLTLAQISSAFLYM